MVVVLVNAGLMAAIFAVLACPAMLRRRSLPWFGAAVLLVLADFLVTSGGLQFQKYIPLFAHSHWNWFGKCLSTGLILLVAFGLAAFGKLRLREMGISFVQAPGTGRAILWVAIPAILLQCVLAATLFGHSGPPSRETILFQASLPGLSEELVFRGVLLAMLDRAFIGRVSLGGAKLGYGAIVIILYFGLIHGLMHPNWVSGLYAAMGGFLFVWLRSRTGSVVVPVFTHNVLNVVASVIPKLL